MHTNSYIITPENKQSLLLPIHKDASTSFTSTTHQSINLIMEPVFVDKSSNSTSPQQSTHLRTGSSNSNPTTSTNLRWVPTKEQKEILEELYSNGLRTPSAEQIEDITRKLKAYGHIEGKNVFYWFQNHKARLRLKQKQQQQLMSIHPAAAASGFNLHKGNNGITSPYHHHLRLPVHQSMPPAPPPSHLLHPKIYTPNGYYMGHTPAAIPQQLDHHHQQQHQMARSYYNSHHHHQQQQQSPFLYNTHTYYTAGLSTTDVNSSTKIPHLRKRRNHNNNNINIENKTLDLFPLHPTAEGRCGAGGNSITTTTTTSSDSDHHHHVNCYDQRFL